MTRPIKYHLYLNSDLYYRLMPEIYNKDPLAIPQSKAIVQAKLNQRYWVYQKARRNSNNIKDIKPQRPENKTLPPRTGPRKLSVSQKQKFPISPKANCASGGERKTLHLLPKRKIPGIQFTSGKTEEFPTLVSQCACIEGLGCTWHLYCSTSKTGTT